MSRQYFIHIDDVVEFDVLLVVLFGVIALMFSEINTCVVLVTYGFLTLRAQSRRRRSTLRTYSIQSKVPGQIEKLHFLVGHHDETCKDHIRMNTNYFNCLCYLLRNLGGLMDTCHVSIRYKISKHFNLVLNTLLKLYNGCLGALDSTYIPVNVPHPNISRYRNRKWNVSVNVLDVCDHHMNFVFVLVGRVQRRIVGFFMMHSLVQMYSIVGYTMDGNYDATHNGRERKRVGSTTRWVWTFVEECELMHTSKELVLKGHKCDNGFRSGYLTILENNLGAKFPGTYLKEELHINSKDTCLEETICLS
ncbi:hypothetical protein ACS0TY_020359 [Phlomoides rotata]